MKGNSRYSNVTSMTNHLAWPSIAARRNLLKLTMLHKIERNLLKNLISMNTVTQGHSYHFTIPSIRTESYASSFLPSTIKLWNELPQSLVMIDNINDLKYHIKQHAMSLWHLLCICVFILPVRFYTVLINRSLILWKISIYYNGNQKAVMKFTTHML